MRYFNVFDINFKFLCKIGTNATRIEIYDPRLNGDGNVIWQETDEKIS